MVENWLAYDYIGLDPPRLLRQRALVSGGRALIGRCDCGCEGCSDYFAGISITERTVVWISDKGYRIEFDKDQYFREIERAKRDHSWEDANRTAERLVDSLFANIETRSGYRYDWFSARVEGGKITLSFSIDGAQKLFKFDWDGVNPESAWQQGLIEKE